MNCIKLWGRAAVTLILTAASAFAAKVSDVKFDQQGIQQLPAEQLRFNIQLRPGAEFKQEILDEDVKRLFNTGNFADVVSEVKRLPDDQVEVTFKLRLKPRVTRVLFQGNAKFSTPELAKEISVMDGALLNDRDLRESAQKLRKFYADKGYLQATVSPVIENDGKDQVKITFQIAEHLKQKVNDVNFEGATVFSQWDLRHAIANQYSYLNWVPFLNDYLNRGLLNKQELEMDKARLRDKYHDAGYLDFKVEDIKLTPDPEDPEYVNVDFKLSEGEPYKVGKVSVSGSTVYTAEELLPLILLSAGEFFSQALEQQSVRNIASRYDVLGYADVTVRPVRSEDYEKHLVDIDFEIVEGRKYTVRDTPVIGNTDTKTKVILREMAIQPGDPVDRNRIEASKQRLMGMGYFEKVEIAAVGADALNEKDVQIRVQEKEGRYNFRVGAGASDVNSLFGMAELSTDNFDIMNPGNWFYGGGQRLRLQGIVGIENNGFNIDFVEPWLFDLPLRFELSGYMNMVEYDHWNEERIGVRTSLSRRVFDDFTQISIGYKFEHVNVNRISNRLKEYMRTNDLDGGQWVSQPSIMIGRDTRDNLMDPTSGYNLNFFGSITPKALGSSNDYYRLEGKGSYYYSFFDKAIVAMVGGKIGTVASFDRNDDVPIFERYFMGGSDSIRGFEYRTVSPKYDGESIGGQTMLLLTAEVTHPIWGPVRGAAFVDAGNAWRNSYSMGFSKMNVGVGYGLRIRLPVINAPIRLDLAYPVVNNVDDEPSRLRFHFNVGFTF
ncbi:MAG: outer membrane protein assembly factor BamA [Lentisphaerae bacterium]|nr:MAG: outer membrane protein assembly factor BamA [Lentisphaerota bacterium]